MIIVMIYVIEVWFICGKINFIKLFYNINISDFESWF